MNSKIINKSLFTGIAAFFAFMIAAPGATAQDAQKTGASIIEEIIVTAQKREERLQDVPLSVSAFTPEMLTKTGVDSTSALSSLVPGLNLNDSVAGFRPFIRGVGAATSAAGNENSVSTYVDNIYMTSMNAGLLNLTNIQSIEVLKGPQGTLFGRNATGGMIHVKTRDPSQEFGGNASVSFDNYETLATNGNVTGGLSENLAADLAVYYRNQYDGYGVNLATGNDIWTDQDFAIRSKLLFTPTDVDTITLAADYSRNDTSGNVLRAWPGFNVQWGGPPDPTNPLLPFGPPREHEGGTWDINASEDLHLESWFTGGSLTYEHEFSWSTFRSFTAYRESEIQDRRNFAPSPYPIQIAGFTRPERQFTQEFQLSSLPDSEVQWILGAYDLDASVKYDPFFITGLSLAPVQLQFVMEQTIESPALYGQVTFPVEALGDTNITASLRYTVDERAITSYRQIWCTGHDQAAFLLSSD